MKAEGQLTESERAYDQMAAVFGTESGSIRRSFSSSEVQNRMIVLSACFRPVQFRQLSSIDPQAAQRGWTLVSVQLQRRDDTSQIILPFRVVLGKDDRWFIEKIDLTNFAC